MEQKSNSFLETEKIGHLMRKYSVPTMKVRTILLSQ